MRALYFTSSTALVLLLIALAAPSGRADAELLAGFAVGEITPDYNVPLGGYGGRLGKVMTGVHDPVCARALVLDNGQARLVLVSLDLIGIDRRCREALVRALRGKVDVLPEHLMICATHTHSGPGGLARDLHWWVAMGVYDDALFRRVIRRTVETIEAACAQLQPARLGVQQAPLPGRNRNRRVDQGPVDDAFTLVRVDRADGTPMGVLMNYAAHPTLLGADNMQVSADYPGALCRELERRHGPGFTAVFTNGDEGDLSVCAPEAPTPFERVEALGAALADEVDRRLPAISTNARVLLRGAVTALDLPAPRLPLVFPARVTLQFLQIQDALFLSVPGEMCAEVGNQVKAAVAGHGQACTAILGLANDHLGYFTSAEGFARGGYEAQMNFYGPGIAAILEDGYRKLVTWEDPWGM